MIDGSEQEEPGGEALGGDRAPRATEGEARRADPTRTVERGRRRPENGPRRLELSRA
jgi:hypothetical protein